MSSKKKLEKIFWHKGLACFKMKELNRYKNNSMNLKEIKRLVLVEFYFDLLKMISISFLEEIVSNFKLLKVLIIVFKILIIIENFHRE